MMNCIASNESSVRLLNVADMEQIRGGATNGTRSFDPNTPAPPFDYVKWFEWFYGLKP